MNSHEQGKHGDSNSSMRHEMGQYASHNKTAEIDHAGPFPNNGEHLIGHSSGQTGFGKHQSNDNGTKDKKH